MRALFLQLGRPLDIAHSLPALQSYVRAQERTHERNKDQTQDSELEMTPIKFVVRDTYLESGQYVADTLEKIFQRKVLEVIAFPTKAILGESIESAEQKTKALAHIITWLADNILEETKIKGVFDLLVNLTYSDSSSFLAQLIPAAEIRGYHRAHDGELAVDDPWSRHICAQVQRQNMNILHLSDLFARVCSAPTTEDQIGARAALAPVSSLSSNSGVVIDFGRAEAGPSIKEDFFAALTQVLLERTQAEITLLGDANQQALLKDFVGTLTPEHKRRCALLPKRLSLKEKMQLLTDDQNKPVYIGQNHQRTFLNSLLAKRAVVLSGGSQRADEVAAYGQNHLFIEFQRDPGEQTESLDALLEARKIAVLTVVEALLVSGNAPFEANRFQALGERIVVSQNRMTACNDGTVRNEMIPLNFRKDEVTNFFEQTFYLIAEFRNAGRYEDLSVPQLGHPEEQPHALDLLLNTFDALVASQKLAGFGSQTCIDMVKNSENKEMLASLGARIGEVENLLKTMKDSVKHIRPLIDAWEVAKDTITGENIVELASKTEATFREFNQNIDLVKELMELAINHAKEQPQKISADSPKEVYPRKDDLI